MAGVKQHVVCTACGAVNAVAPDRDAKAAKCGVCARPLFAGEPTDVDAAGFERQTKRSDVAWTRAALTSSQETTHDHR